MCVFPLPVAVGNERITKSGGGGGVGPIANHLAVGQTGNKDKGREAEG
jgi:hypothetical protein